MVTQDKSQVSLERRFSASPERVYRAWLEPAILRRWMFGPGARDEDLIELTIDARVGGFFCMAVRRQGETSRHRGRYLQMNPPWRLVFTWDMGAQAEDQSRVTIDLLPSGPGCELILTHELRPHLASHAARTEAEWIEMLSVLASALDAPDGKPGDV